MTITDLQLKRDEILKRVGVTHAHFGDKSVQYSDAKAALAVIDAEITKTLSQADPSAPRVSYSSFSND